jgi:hypothetical protein
MIHLRTLLVNDEKRLTSLANAVERFILGGRSSKRAEATRVGYRAW